MCDVNKMKNICTQTEYKSDTNWRSKRQDKTENNKKVTLLLQFGYNLAFTCHFISQTQTQLSFLLIEP